MSFRPTILQDIEDAEDAVAALETAALRLGYALRQLKLSARRADAPSASQRDINVRNCDERDAAQSVREVDDASDAVVKTTAWLADLQAFRARAAGNDRVVAPAGAGGDAASVAGGAADSRR